MGTLQKSFIDNNSWKRSLVRDLIWGEKSPALVAIALNAIILITPLLLLLVLNFERGINRNNPLFALALAGSLAMVYAALAQFMLFLKNRYRIFWTIATLTALIVLPIIIALLLTANTSDNYFPWFFSVAAPLITLFADSYPISPIQFLFAIFCQLVTVWLLVFKLKQQLDKTEELT